jgi:DNA-binding MarR family transcriptional regulator
MVMVRRKNPGAPTADLLGQAPPEAGPTATGLGLPRAQAVRKPKPGAKGPGPNNRSGEAAPGSIDASYLEGLIGYNTRRAALAVISVFLERMKPYGLRPVEFSTLSLIAHNPGVTARQLCHALGVLPPNMVGLVNGLERRELIERRPHPSDRRAQGLHLSAKATAMMQAAERTAAELEQDAAHRLSPAEQKTLMGLLQKIYR